MGCKWCDIQLDWRNENGKNIPYEVTDPKYQKRHQCPKDPRNNNRSESQPAAATSTPTSSSPASKPDPRSDIVIVGNLSDQVKTQIGNIVEERLRKILQEVFVLK